MTRFYTTLACLSLFAFSTTVMAQGYHTPRTHGHLHDHDYWHQSPRVLDVHKMDGYSDQLAKIARHLHEDAHQLPQVYEHSESIEHYVDQLDRLQQHMHEILHDAARTGHQSSSLARHIQSDIRQSKALLTRLYRELQHQGFDGARASDYQAMVHMRHIITDDAFPLIREMERAAFGYAHPTHEVQTSRVETHRWPVQQSNWTRPRTRVRYRW